MYQQDYSVRIIGGTERSDGYVEIKHGTQYKIVLGNYRSVRCDANVAVDGDSVGIWRLGPRDTLTLERPANDTGCFTAYLVDSEDGSKAELEKVASPRRGLIQVTFTPELVFQPATINIAPTVLLQPWNPWSPAWPYRRFDRWAEAGNATWDTTCAAIPASYQMHSVTAHCGEDVVRPPQNNFLRASYAADAPSYKEMGTGLSGESKQQFVDVGAMPLDYTQQYTISLRLVEPRPKYLGPRPLRSRGNPVPPPVGA